jgi:hypothetical protein
MIPSALFVVLRAFSALVLLACVGTVRSEQVLVLVSDSSSGLPVSGATVSLERNGKSVAEAETDSEGRAAFSGLAPGNHVLRVEKSGYLDLLDPAGRGREVAVAASNTNTTNIRVTLSRTAVISGFVRDSEGGPLQGATVRAIARRGAEGARFTRVGQLSRTDDMGRYRLFGLPAGRYSVVVVPRGSESAAGSFAPAFYGSADSRQAVFFELQPGEIRTSVDLIVAGTQRSSISGTVAGTPSDSTPGRAAVALVKDDLDFLAAAVLTDSEGAFSIPEVPAGDYHLIAWTPFKGWELPPWPSSKATARVAAQKVSASGADLRVSLALRPLVTVRGNVIWEGSRGGGQACSGAGEIVFQSQDGWPEEWMPAVVPEDDRFRVAALPAGRYRIETHKLRGSCPLVEVRVGDQPAPLGVALLDGSTSLTLLLTNRTGDVSGAVTADEASPAAGIVLLAPVDADGVVQVAQINAEGRYQFRDVLAGQYRLMALSRLDSTDYLDSVEAKNLGAKLVLVEGGKKLTSDLKLVRK